MSPSLDHIFVSKSPEIDFGIACGEKLSENGKTPLANPSAPKVFFTVIIDVKNCSELNNHGDNQIYSHRSEMSI